MNGNKKHSPVVNIGSSLLLVIFLVLCLVTFATLSLSSARSDYGIKSGAYGFSSRLAERKTDYYRASSQAETILDQIDTVLAEAYKDAPGTYYSTVEKKLSALTPVVDTDDVVLEVNISAKKPSVSYQVPVNDKQFLSVVLELLPADEEDGFYRVTQWKVVSQAEWNGDNTLKLIK